MALKTHVVEPEITVVELSGNLNLGNLLVETEHRIKKLVEAGARKLANGAVSKSFEVVHREEIVPLDADLAASIQRFSSAQAAG